MDTTVERTVSGRAFVVAGLVVVAIITAIGVIFGPGLRDEVRQEQRPRTLREPVALGIIAGETWEAVGRFDGTSNCVELRTEGEVIDRACDTGPRLATTVLHGTTVAYGVAPETATEKVLELDNGDLMTAPVRAGELGFPVGFWAAAIPKGAGLAADQD